MSFGLSRGALQAALRRGYLIKERRESHRRPGSRQVGIRTLHPIVTAKFPVPVAFLRSGKRTSPQA